MSVCLSGGLQFQCDTVYVTFGDQGHKSKVEVTENLHEDIMRRDRDTVS